MISLKTFSTLTSIGLAAIAVATIPSGSGPTIATFPAKSAVAEASPMTSGSSLSALMGAASVSMSTATVASGKKASAGTLFPAFIGRDTNSALNPFVQPQLSELSGGGRDQTMQFHDLLLGFSHQTSVLVGRLGEDILVGGGNIDFLIGGPEHFNPNNRDKAFGGFGDDVFIWAPGDGSDRFDGGPGEDTIIFGLIGEDDGSGNPSFGVSNDQLAGDVFLDFFGLPMVDVTNSPGFCNVIDDSTSASAAADLSNIGVDHLVQFFIRGINNAFVNGVQNTDNGLRVTLHLKDVEYLVCTDPNGGAIVAFDLRTSPPTPIAISSLPFAVQFIIQ